MFLQNPMGEPLSDKKTSKSKEGPLVDKKTCEIQGGTFGDEKSSKLKGGLLVIKIYQT